MSATFEHPQQFKAMQWPREEAQKMEMKNVEWKSPQQGQVVIRVHVAGLNSTDNISRYNLIGSVHYPSTPGSNIVGEIVEIGQGVRNLKKGQHVAAVLSHKGLAEYAIADEQFVCPLSDKQKSMEETVVEAFDGARIDGSLSRFEREMEHEDQQRYQEINRRMGFDGAGVCVVYGQGGCARLALDILRNCQSRVSKDSKLVLIATSDKWHAKDYGLQEQDFLCVSKHNLAKELRNRGGARFVVAVDQPQHGLEQLLDGMRYRSQMIVLNPDRDHKVQLPLGNVIAKDLSIRAPVYADSKSIERALDLFQRNNIKVPTNRYKFDQDQVNEAWQQLEKRTKFDAPIILMHN
ncbi:uncharacterized protein JCM15063_001162 [Sporobolomyces koalae]|uniref:uncharacterized protein n=1 Tax=Sporobolomyces koalae TaxID=500713 RepID=UPI00317D1C4C